MKILTIGDLHGKSVWKNAKIEDYDKVIFVGDYTDSWDAIDQDIINNLTEIINLKLEMPDKIILLLGNHDNQYLDYPANRCSGFRPQMQYALTQLFIEHRGLFCAAYQEGSLLWTHAGVSASWRKRRHFDQDDVQNLGAAIQWAYLSGGRERIALYDISQQRGGHEPFGGIFWADRTETYDDIIDGLHQIVGHSIVPEIFTSYNENETGSFTYVDCLDNTIRFLQIEIHAESISFEAVEH